MSSSIYTQDSPRAASTYHKNIAPSGEQLTTDLSFSGYRHDGSHEASFLYIAFITVSAPPSHQVLQRPPLVPPVHLRQRHPSQPRSGPPRTINTRVKHRPKLIHMTRTRTMRKAQTPPTTRVTHVRVLHSRLVALALRQIPDVPLLRNVNRHLPSLVSNRNMNIMSYQHTFLRSSIPIARSNTHNLRFLISRFIRRISNSIYIAISRYFPSFSYNVHISVQVYKQI